MDLFLYYPCLRAGFFILYFRCPLDMLSQILNYKTQDCGKIYVLLSQPNLVLISALILLGSNTSFVYR
jgi:hypothetical protein